MEEREAVAEGTSLDSKACSRGDKRNIYFKGSSSRFRLVPRDNGLDV